MKYYDLLRGAEPYKFYWANETRATFAVHVASDSLSARMAVARDRAAEAARAMAQTLLPASALAIWRRWRQSRMRRSLIEDGDKGVTVNEEIDGAKTVKLAATVLISLICP